MVITPSTLDINLDIGVVFVVFGFFFRFWAFLGPAGGHHSIHLDHQPSIDVVFRCFFVVGAFGVGGWSSLHPL